LHYGPARPASDYTEPTDTSDNLGVGMPMELIHLRHLGMVFGSSRQPSRGDHNLAPGDPAWQQLPHVVVLGSRLRLVEGCRQPAALEQAPSLPVIGAQLQRLHLGRAKTLVRDPAQ
jgi:hypothetical protein